MKFISKSGRELSAKYRNTNSQFKTHYFYLNGVETIFELKNHREYGFCLYATSDLAVFYKSLGVTPGAKKVDSVNIQIDEVTYNKLIEIAEIEVAKKKREREEYIQSLPKKIMLEYDGDNYDGCGFSPKRITIIVYAVEGNGNYIKTDNTRGWNFERFNFEKMKQYAIEKNIAIEYQDAKYGDVKPCIELTREQADEIITIADGEAKKAAEIEEAKKQAIENQKKEKRDAIFAIAKQTGESQVLEKNFYVEDTKNGEIWHTSYILAMPDGTEKYSSQGVEMS